MLEWVLSSIIRIEFEKEVGRWQKKKDTPQGMFLALRGSSPEKEKNDYYYHYGLFLYAPFSYVEVYEKEWWLPKFEGQERGEKPYSILANHDSCWTEGVDNFLFNHGKNLTTLDFVLTEDKWYKKVEVTEDLYNQLNEAKERWRDRE